MSRFTSKTKLPLITEALSPEITFSDFFQFYYRDMSVRLKPSTLSSKKLIFTQKILPFFGSLQMREITPQHIRKWQSIILKQNYSQTHQRLIDSQLSALMNYAERYYDFPNPCKKVEHIGSSRTKVLNFWTLEEYEQFISYFSSEIETFTAFEILYWTGMRQGELLALTPSDIDMRYRRISITKSYTRVGGQDIISTPKTRKSIRNVDIPNFLLNEIKIYIRTARIQPEQRLFDRSTHYLFFKLKQGCKATGVKTIRTHDLRHSHVSLLINAGFSALDIADRVGHESVSTTLDIYAHIFPNQQQLMANCLDSLHNNIVQ